MRLIFVCAMSLLLFSAPAIAWDLNDVSILLPLPKDLKSETLLRANQMGDGGPVITEDSFDQVPVLGLSRDHKREFNSLRAIGFRIDPCFPGDTPGACRPQIRIVWQPLLESQDGVHSVDAAVHTFYDLTPQEFAQLAKDLKKLNVRSANPQTLSVHPIAAREGLSGTYVTTLHRTLLRYIGAKRLTRLTFMAVRGASIFWAFGGFDLQAGINPMPMEIARIVDRPKSHQQAFVNTSVDNTDFQRANMAPAPLGADTFNFLVTDSKDIDAARDESKILKSLNAIDRIENPKIHSPATIDCASCHTAQAARSFAETQFPDLVNKAGLLVAPFASTFDLTNLSPVRTHTRNMRAFGYFDREPAISQRVINESAEVAEALAKF